MKRCEDPLVLGVQPGVPIARPKVDFVLQILLTYDSDVVWDASDALERKLAELRLDGLCLDHDCLDSGVQRGQANVVLVLLLLRILECVVVRDRPHHLERRWNQALREHQS